MSFTERICCCSGEEGHSEWCFKTRLEQLQQSPLDEGQAPDFPPDSSGTGSVAGDAREPPSPVGLSAVAYAAVSETLLDRSMEAMETLRWRPSLLGSI